MIKYKCLKCNAALEADDQQVGVIGKCVKCQAPVQVPAKASPLPLILSFAAGSLAGVLGTCMCGFVLSFLLGAGVSVLGQNANSAFGTVGTSIGATVSSGR